VFESKINILLVEDNAPDARLVREMVKAAASVSIAVNVCECLGDAYVAVPGGEYDLILLDLNLPDGHGIETFLKLHGRCSDVPFIVLTGLNDEDVAMQAIKRGAQDYLVKDQLNDQVLIKAIRYAIERFKLLSELETIMLVQRQKHEFRLLDGLSSQTRSYTSAEVLGLNSLEKAASNIFNTLVKRYCGLLDRALDQRILKTDFNISKELLHMGNFLGSLRANPKDVIEIHSRALKTKLNQAKPKKAQAFMEEARLLVLELMGYLASYYNNLAGGMGIMQPNEVKQVISE
jgi:DNA-binding NarL/FixJ family response regulator